MTKILLLLTPLLLTACGGGGGGGPATPEPINLAPTITDPGALSVQEGRQAVATISATDPEGDLVTFSLQGTDAAAFAITSDGTVTFVDAPDYSTPIDSDADNVYQVTVVASDGAVSSSVALVVTVINTILPTAVIDGYVSGANVFVDMNWNLVQDDGEPSATENITSETYDFLPSEFATVNDFTESCAVNRPRIAEVPVGAVDSVRGTVTEAYTMLYFPSALDSYEKVNVTPFTTLFTGFVLDAVGTTTITVADSCDSDANDIADSVIQEVQEVLADLEQTYGVGPNYFYEDFIQSLDEEKQQIGELIVNFLTTIHEIEGVLEEFYEVQLLSYPSRELVSTILSGEAFDTAEFNIVTHTIPEQVDEYFEYSKQYNFEHLVADSSGQLLDRNGDPITITLENIRENSAFATYENYFSDPDAIVTGRRVEIRISNIKNLEGVTDSRTSIRFSIEDDECSLVLAQYYENEVFERRASNECSEQAYTELRFMNSLNTYFDYDLATIVQNRDVITINAIYDELYAMPTGINNRDNMTYYLLDGDQLVFELYRTFRWYYGLQYNENREDEEWCEKFSLDDHTLMQRWTGADAYPVCFDVMQCTSGHAGSSC